MADTAGVKKKVRKRRGIARILPEKPGYAVLVLIMALLAIAFLVMLAIVNAFPRGLTMGLIGVMLVMLILAGVLFGRKSRVARICGLFVAVLFIGGYGLATYYLGTTYAAFAKMSAGNERAAEVAAESPVGKPFNVYITGIDMWNYEKGQDLERSDVNMIITVCPQTRKVLLTSIPRDAYVKLHTAGQMDKLTHTGVYGVDETINTVQDWLGIDLNYYVKVNFTSVVKVINATGGVKVYSPKDFKSSISRFKFHKGWNTLSGKEALYFARERKAFDGEDSQRVDNQQAVVKAMLNNLTTSSTLLTKYDELLEIAADDLETNMPMSDMQDLVKMQLADLSKWEIETQKIEGEYDMDYVASLTQEQKFQVYKTDPDSVAKCIDNINRIMNPTEEEIQAQLEKKKEATAKALLNKLLPGKKDDAETEDTEG